MLECGPGHGSRRSPRVLEFHPGVDAAVTRRFALRSEHMCFNVDQHAAIASYDKLPGGDNWRGRKKDSSSRCWSLGLSAASTRHRGLLR